MKFISLSGLGISLTMLLFSCGQHSEPSATSTKPAKSDTAAAVMKGDVWAAQVESNTEMLKPDGWLDEDWQSRFKGLDKKLIYSTVLDAVLSGKQKAYDFFTEAEYTVDNVKEIVAKIKPEDISLIKVREKWNFDKDKFSLLKQTTRMTLCIRKYRSDSTVMGDSPLFFVKLNN